MKPPLKAAVRTVRPGWKWVLRKARLARRPAYSKPGAPSRFFEFRGRSYRYFYHGYNLTWRNERAVEIPIVREVLEGYEGEKALEVGNVLSHYFQADHEIVDKYEAAPGVRNCDVLDISPEEEYGLIVSISTLEHVGWDEEPRDPEKVIVAFDRLREALAPGGLMVITVPVGPNTEIVRYALEGTIPFRELYALKKISRDNLWREVEPSEAADTVVGDPFPHSNGVLIGYYYATEDAPGLLTRFES